MTLDLTSPRGSDAIGVFPANDQLRIFTLLWQSEPGRDGCTVVAKVSCDLPRDGQLTPSEMSDAPSGDLHVADALHSSVLYPSDFALLKRRCDVTLNGHAHAPRSASTASTVRFTFGGGRGFDRRIAVFGPRQWKNLAATEPALFSTVALVYENAFGGPGHAANPIGKGVSTALLPQLEDPEALINSPSNRPKTMGFGPIPPMWQQRWSKVGTYDQEWIETRFPNFAADLDPLFFQAAPPEQQLDELTGKERFAITGMHPKQTVIEGRLPGLQPRCFVQRTEAAGGTFHELSLRLDTVHFDLDAMKVHQVWRGHMRVTDDTASDVVELFAFLDEPAGPHTTLDAARQRYVFEKAAYSHIDLTPAAAAMAANELSLGSSEDAMARHEQKLRDRLQGAGLAGSLLEAPSQQPDAPVAEPPRWPPPEDCPIRKRAVQLLAGDAPLDSCELAGGELSGLDFSRRSLINADLKGCRLVGCRFVGAVLRGAQLSESDLSDALLDQAALDGADFTQTKLHGASLKEVTMLTTSFQKACGEGASFRGAKGSFTRFDGSSWQRACFDGVTIDAADFSHADLVHTSFKDAALPELRLYDAVGERVSFDRSDLTGARADGVCLKASSLVEITAPSSTWLRATLQRCSFSRAKLCSAGFERSLCPRIGFAGADLREARFARAQLVDAQLQGANLMAGILEACDLRGADLTGANLYTAETHKALLQGAKLDGAFLAKTKLEGK